ncbi:MAG TPA: glycogen/starch/alpha-glucan phosphorylase, partial [Roseiarcus sp.]|nr:glycogen/starch/alpha-glucan phosphorylase [Roseiarcus sp.]
EHNLFLFGLTAEEVANSRPWYSPYWHYENEPETRAALDLIFSDHFSQNEPGIFEPLRGALLTYGDQFMHLADLASYLTADGKLCDLYRKSDEWTKKVIVNIAASGKFSSDRTIGEYARDIWGAKLCRVRSTHFRSRKRRPIAPSAAGSPLDQYLGGAGAVRIWRMCSAPARARSLCELALWRKCLLWEPPPPAWAVPVVACATCSD